MCQKEFHEELPPEEVEPEGESCGYLGNMVDPGF